WSNRLMELATSEVLSEEAGYWLKVARAPAHPLPVDLPEGENTAASQRTLRTSLTEEETKALLTEAPAAYKTQINDLLLTALAQASYDWTGQRSLLVDLEGHGR